MNHPADIRHFREADRIERIERSQERHAAYLLSDLLSAGGSDELADERVAENLPVAALRRAYLLCQSGARDAALTAFCDAFHDACAGAAEAEAAECARAAVTGGR